MGQSIQIEIIIFLNFIYIFEKKFNIILYKFLANFQKL
jgi:hypothetical protein